MTLTLRIILSFSQAKIWVTPFLFFFILNHVAGQKVIIQSISFSGLRKTKPYILERELTFARGDTIDLKELLSLVSINEARLINTGLLTSATINLRALELQQGTASFDIQVREALYLYPIPLLEFLNNDFNKWWKNYNRSLKTLSYGLYIKHINLTGNADELTVYGQAGFTRKVSLEYDYPYLNASRTLGAGITAYHARNREVAYTTSGNYLQFHRDLKHDQLKRTLLGGRLTYRPLLNVKHTVSLHHYSIRVSDSISKFRNPEFLNGFSKLDFPLIAYSVVIDKRDISTYPLRGLYATGWIYRDGKFKNDPVNIFHTGAQFSKFSPLAKSWFLENTVRGRYNLDRGKPPYFFNKALGYDETELRGYEYYVIDGQDYAYTKNSMRFRFFKKEFNLERWIPWKSYNKMPVSAFLTANTDVGYVWDRYYANANPFSNRTLIGYGLGLDVTFYHNKLARLEVSRNHTGQVGVYLHFDAGL